MLSSRRVSWIGFTALYAAVTAAYAWPVVSSITTVLPNDIGDPGLNAWILWWNSQAMPFTQRWWDAPIFYPARGAFALSETLVGLTPLTSPLHWAGLDAVTVYNLAYLASFPAAALSAHALAFRLTGRHDAAVVAALAFGFNPYRGAQIPHLQMLWSMWMPLCLLALHRYLETRRRRDLVLAGSAFVFNGLTCGYYLVYFSILVAGWMLWFARSRREWIAIATTFAIAGLVLAPTLVGYARHQREFGVSRSTEEIEAFSADLSAFWAVSENVALPARWTVKPRAEGELYPGVVVVLLTIAGTLVAWQRARRAGRQWAPIVMGVLGVALAVAAVVAMRDGGWAVYLLGLPVSLTRPGKALFTAVCLLVLAVVFDRRTAEAWHRRSALFFYVVAAVVMALFALGPTGHAFGTKFLYDAPYSWLMMLPGGHALRVPARFGMLVVLCLSVTAAIGFSRVRRTRAPLPVVAVIAVAVLADGWMPHFVTAEVPPGTIDTPTQDRSLPLAELPMHSVFTETAAMLRATRHGHRLVNGFSGYAPPHYDLLRDRLNDLDPAAIAALQKHGPLLVFVDRVLDEDGTVLAFMRGIAGAVELWDRPTGTLFRLPGAAASAPAMELPIGYVDANTNYGNVKLMLDRNLDTAWQTAAPQHPGDQVIIVFHKPVDLSLLELDLGGARMDYPRALAVDVADAGRPPVRLWEGSATSGVLLGAMKDFRRAPVMLYLPDAAGGQRFTLTIQRGDPEFYWSIAELRAFGSYR